MARDDYAHRRPDVMIDDRNYGSITTITDALRDLLHNAHRIALKGQSRRKEEDKKDTEDPPEERPYAPTIRPHATPFSIQHAPIPASTRAPCFAHSDHDRRNPRGGPTQRHPLTRTRRETQYAVCVLQSVKRSKIFRSGVQETSAPKRRECLSRAAGT